MVQRQFNREKTVYLKNDAEQLNQMSIWKTEGRMEGKKREEEEEKTAKGGIKRNSTYISNHKQKLTGSKHKISRRKSGRKSLCPE